MKTAARLFAAVSFKSYDDPMFIFKRCMSREAVIYFACSIALSVVLFLYYVNVHYQWMDRYPLRFKGLPAAFLCLLIALPIIHIAVQTRQAFAERPKFLTPGLKKCVIAIAIFLLTPALNFLYIPIPIGFVVLRGTDLAAIQYLFVAGFAILAYFVTCLAWRSTAKPRGSPALVLLYLWAIYVGDLLFTGIYYI